MHQKAGRSLLPPPNATAQLMQRRQAKAFRLFNQHDGRFGHIHADFNDRGRHQDIGPPGGEIAQGGFTYRNILQAMGKANTAGEMGGKLGKAVLGGDTVILLAAGNGAHHPIGAGAARHCLMQAGDNLRQAFLAEDSRGDGLAPRRFARHAAHGHFAPLRQQQRARNGRCGHHQHIRGLALIRQQQALRHTKAVLFIHHRQAQILEGDPFLKQRMSANHDGQRAIRQPLQDAPPFLALHAAGQQRHRHARRAAKPLETPQMLAREQFRRRHQRGLSARFHRAQHGHQRHQRLARAHIALQQPEHSPGGREIRIYLGHGLKLGRRWRMAKGGQGRAAQAFIAHQRAPRPFARPAPHQAKGDLPRQQFIIAQPAARRRGPLAFWRM